jgi:hypothetical protein
LAHHQKHLARTRTAPPGGGTPLGSRCTICANPQVDAISAAFDKGTAIRAMARDFHVSRSALSRHGRHVLAARVGSAGRDHFEEAVRMLGRASTPRDRLRAMEAIRSALALELRDHARARTATKTPSGSQLRQLERNVEAAWREYESTAGGSLDVALRALSGVREAWRPSGLLLPAGSMIPWRSPWPPPRGNRSRRGRHAERPP